MGPPTRSRSRSIELTVEQALIRDIFEQYYAGARRTQRILTIIANAFDWL